MTERAVSIVHHAREIGLRDGAADELAHDLAGGLRIGPSGKPGDVCAGELRPGLGDIEAAVAGEPRERHVNEAERGGFASRGNVAHAMSWVAEADTSRARRRAQGSPDFVN